MNYLKIKDLYPRMGHINLSAKFYKFILIILFGIALFCFPFISSATNGAIIENQGSDNTSSDIQRLHTMYKIESIQLNYGPYGPVGLFHITGDITPRAAMNNMGVVESDPRSIARSFLIEQARLFSISNVDEDIKEQKLTTDRHGRTHILYHRYINGLKMEGVEILIHIGSDKKIFAVNGKLIPVTYSLINNVVNKSTGGLSEEEIRGIIEQDIGQDKIDPGTIGINKIEKVVIPSDPYIVWKVDVILKKGIGRWLYTIDAFTGRVLEKRENIQYDAPHTKKNLNNITPVNKERGEGHNKLNEIEITSKPKGTGVIITTTSESPGILKEVAVTIPQKTSDNNSSHEGTPAKSNLKDILQNDNESHGVINKTPNELKMPSSTQEIDSKSSSTAILLREIEITDQDFTEKKTSKQAIPNLKETDYSKNKHAQDKREALSR